MNNDSAAVAIADRVLKHVNAERLESAIAELARFGGREDGGVSRQALTETENQARRYLIDKAMGLGFEVQVDACANLFFRRPGLQALPPVLTGSHIDTQPVGGKFDGAYGVVAGLEVLQALKDAGVQTYRPVEVVIWTNEEGSRFSPGAMGSSSFVDPDRLPAYLRSIDADGCLFAAALKTTLDEVSDITRREQKTPVAAFIEAHIEQGPKLEMEHAPLGVVTGIQGVRWYQVQCLGIAAHAGTTPMTVRRDAMTMAIDVARQLNELASLPAYRDLRLTMGRWHVEPNSINTIPGRVQFSIDARCVSGQVLDDFERRLAEVVLSHPECGSIQHERIFERASTPFPDELQQLVETACGKAGGKPSIKLISGAFHDAMYLADHCPTSMLFVRSKDGISHNAAEYSDPHDLFLGAKALAYVVATLACSPNSVSR